MTTDQPLPALATGTPLPAGAETVARRTAVDVAFGGLLVALLLLPLYPKIGLASVGGTYIPVRPDDVIFLGAMGLWAIQLWRERRRPHVPPVLTPAVAWLALGLLAVAIGAGLLHTVAWTTSFLYWAKPIEYLMLGWLAFDLVRDPGRRRVVLAVVYGTALLVIGYGLLERWGWVATPATYVQRGNGFGVVTSTFGDRHQLSMYLGMLLLLGVVLWRHAPRPWQVAALVGAVLAVYVMSQTATRSEYVTLGVLSLALLVPPRTRIAAAGLVVVLVAIYFLPGSVERGLDSVLANRNPPSPFADPAFRRGNRGVAGRGADLNGDVSLSMRLEQKWPALIRAGMRDPIFGIGPSGATEAADGHYVRSFVEVGIVGTAAFVWLILAIARRLKVVYDGTRGPPRDLALAVLLMLVFFGLVSVFIDAWVASRPMQLLWPLVGIALAAGGSAMVSPVVVRTPETAAVTPSEGA
jgi:hypothetical protein